MLVNTRRRNSSRRRRPAARRVCAAPPWPRADSPAAGRWTAALDTPGVGARQRVAGRGLPLPAPTARGAPGGIHDE
jgi:hypothetical protein